LPSALYKLQRLFSMKGNEEYVQWTGWEDRCHSLFQGTLLVLHLKGWGNKNPQSEGPSHHTRFKFGTFWIQVKSCYCYANTYGHKFLKEHCLYLKCRFAGMLVKIQSRVLNKYSVFHWKHRSIALY
jgi:hypothetical protein